MPTWANCPVKHQPIWLLLPMPLAEMPLAKARETAIALWKACENTLLVIEPGTPQGFARIHEVRVALLAEGAHLIAPCTHVNSCPIQPPDWCHFSVRLARRREHMHAKKATVPFEDEKFSYLIASRQPGALRRCPHPVTAG